MKSDIEISFENKTYKLGPLTFKDLAEYVLWYQYKELEDALIITKDLPDELRLSILKETHERCRTKRWILKDENTGDIVKETFLSWETPEVQQSTETPDGIAQQCYLSLRVNHPDITKELAWRICQPKVINEILDKILQAQGLSREKILTAEEKLPGESIPNQQK
jgi:hypothetical protein